MERVVILEHRIIYHFSLFCFFLSLDVYRTYFPYGKKQDQKGEKKMRKSLNPFKFHYIDYEKEQRFWMAWEGRSRTHLCILTCHSNKVSIYKWCAQKLKCSIFYLSKDCLERIERWAIVAAANRRSKEDCGLQKRMRNLLDTSTLMGIKVGVLSQSLQACISLFYTMCLSKSLCEKSLEYIRVCVCLFVCHFFLSPLIMGA